MSCNRLRLALGMVCTPFGSNMFVPQHSDCKKRHSTSHLFPVCSELSQLKVQPLMSWHGLTLAWGAILAQVLHIPCLVVSDLRAKKGFNRARNIRKSMLDQRMFV